MLMIDHKSDIDHILHELEQIEHAEFDDRNELPILMHSRMLAHEVTKELMHLLKDIEIEELSHSNILADPKLIEDMCVLAYYMSAYGCDTLVGKVMTLEEAAIYCSEIIDCNALSLINMKVMYDDYTKGIRNGWSSARVIPEDMIFVMNICEGMTEQELLIACHRILGIGN